MGRDKQDTSVRKGREGIGREGWAAKIFAKQKENTYWENKETCYVPKFSSTGWQVAVLVDLGVTSDDPRFANAVEHFFDFHNVEAGGFSMRPRNLKPFDPDVCNAGNIVRALSSAGYSRDDSVRKTVGCVLY